MWVTIWFTLAQNALTIVVAGILAFATDRVVRARGLYRSVVLLPYAIAPVIAGILWAFLFNPSVGPVAHVLKAMGVAWDPIRSGFDAFLLVTFAAAWKHICYNYIFLVAALLAVPASLLEAAAVDGAGPRLALLPHRPAHDRTDDILPAGDELRLRFLRDLRHHRCGDARRAGRRHHDLGLQGLSATVSSISTSARRRPSRCC